jgi:hypothetical protein
MATHIPRGIDSGRSISVVSVVATSPTAMRMMGTRNSDGGSEGPFSRRAPDDSRLTGFFFLTTRGGSCGAADRGAPGREELFPEDFGGRADSDIVRLPARVQLIRLFRGESAPGPARKGEILLVRFDIFQRFFGALYCFGRYRSMARQPHVSVEYETSNIELLKKDPAGCWHLDV